MSFAGDAGRYGKTIKRSVSTLLLSLISISAAIAQEPVSADLDGLFAEAAVNATLVIENLDASERYVYEEQRAATRFCPASTFKVPNSLIALDEGAATGEGVEFRWDGTDRSVAAWNQDHTLASAIRVSCVWCYQQVAREVGREAYTATLERLNYGNATIGKAVDQFWLDGSLQISANEQVRFLRSLRQAPTPFSEAQIAVLDNIMKIHSEEGYTLRGKTGWTGQDLHIGWYVGSIESEDETWLFAMNFDMYEASRASLRQALTLRAFRQLGILPMDWGSALN